MIRNAEAVEAFERDFTRDVTGRRTYAEALAIFTALWRWARSLNPDFPGDWESDIEPDLAVARAINGLPPSP